MAFRPFHAVQKSNGQYTVCNCVQPEVHANEKVYTFFDTKHCNVCGGQNIFALLGEPHNKAYCKNCAAEAPELKNIIKEMAHDRSN